jgi:hypothetical protein
MLARIAAVVVGYALYLALRPGSLVGAVLGGAGVILLGWAVIDATMRLRRRGLAQAGEFVAGAVLLAAGLWLAVS